jgi:hypothetical protein
MVYQYRGSQTIALEQERQEQLKAELEAEKAKLREAMRIRRENERLEAQILATQQRAAELAKPVRRIGLPEPIHGGRIGLKRAAEEAAAHTRRQERKAA